MNLICGKKLFMCDDYMFACNVNEWNTIRKTILKLTFEYIIDKFEEDMKDYVENSYDESYIDEKSRYNYCKTEVMNIITNMEKDYSKALGIDRTIELFISLINKKGNIDALNYFGIGGISALCNKNDNNGYYSPGNSLDICILLDLIKPLIMLQNNTDYNFIYNCQEEGLDSVYDVFEYSYKSIKNVRIT